MPGVGWTQQPDMVRARREHDGVSTVLATESYGAAAIAGGTPGFGQSRTGGSGVRLR
jgi:hypothetical protein